MSIVLKDGTTLPDLPDGVITEETPYSFVLDSQSIGFFSYTISEPLLVLPAGITPEIPIDFLVMLPGRIKMHQYQPEKGWVGVYDASIDEVQPMESENIYDEVKWTNHDIYFIDQFNPDDFSYTVGTEIAIPSDIAKPPIILPDGTEIPALPNDVLAEYPNAIIYKVGGSEIVAMLSKKPFAYGSANFYASLGITVVGPAIGTLGNGVLYRLNGEWEKTNDFTPAQSVVVVGDGLYDLQWSNHNVMVVQSANLSTMTANTNGEVYYAVDDVLVLKDGTKLIAPTKELFEEMPYGIVVAYMGSGLYALITAEKQLVACREDMLPSDVVLGSDDTHGIFAQPGKWKRWIAGEEWTLGTEKTAEKLDALYIISVAKWANHDLCELSELNADYTYTIGSEIARKSDVNYRVTGGYMTSITNEGRRLGGVAGEMKPDVLESTLRKTEPGNALAEENAFFEANPGASRALVVDSVDVIHSADNPRIRVPDSMAKNIETLIVPTLTELPWTWIETNDLYPNGYSNLKLKNVYLMAATSLSKQLLAGQNKLEQVFAPKATIIHQYAFRDCELTEIPRDWFPELIELGDFSFEASYELVRADFLKLSRMDDYCFSSCSSLKAVVLRNTSGVCTMETKFSITFPRTPIFNGKGVIIVPSALIGDYQTSWTAFVASGSKFLKIEDYTVDGTLTGDIDWDRVDAYIATL